MFLYSELDILKKCEISDKKSLNLTIIFTSVVRIHLVGRWASMKLQLEK